MVRLYYDEDVDPTALKDETSAVIGYGIQGRAQCFEVKVDENGVSLGAQT